MPNANPVLIAGAGPVGLTMAAELARFGVPVRIIDKAPHRSDKSKALVLWSRSLELFDRLGCSQSLLSAGLPVRSASITAGHKPIAHIRLDDVASPHPYALMLAQSETERLLEEHLNSRGVRVERQVELISFGATADGVTATLRSVDGREEIVHTSWLIGCDGAHSTVRHGLDLSFEGDTLPSDWILADVHLEGIAAEAPEIKLFWHADGVLAAFPIAPPRYRVIADVGDGRPTSAPCPDPTLEQVQAILDQRGPGGIRAADPIWLSAFRINERKVKDYRVGRVFLAGDAAHIHSPAGGQGMNTGMQDAFNLAWKLALVHHGQADAEPLLNSYSVERSDVGRQVLKDAGRLTALAIMRGSVTQSIRNYVASLVLGFAPVRETMANKLTELSIGYAHSPLTRGGAHRHGPAAGQRVPLPVEGGFIGAGERPRFALFAVNDAQSQALIAQHRDVMEPTVRLPFDDSAAWLVRPDGYVAMTAPKSDLASISAHLSAMLGRA